MKRYRVVVSKEAINDLNRSLEWGFESRGQAAARHWYADLKASVKQLLGSFPASQPIAQDNDEYDVETRQTIVGRYRVIFTVQGNIVTVLHIRGPYEG